ncbi:hypothetical protein [Nocardiopsis sp. NPDC057823]|uniref:hypothetical protein n=1 Tax=Nocardiopsis TaxID=2013 RepID=UPI00366BE6DC
MSGVGTALLSEVLARAAARGMRACDAEWASANLVSDAFWREHRFAPVRCTLTRHLDTRPDMFEPATPTPPA